MVFSGYNAPMKFILAWLVMLTMAVTLGVGILLALNGNLWLLVAAVVGYLLAFARLGCSQGAPH